MMNPNSSDLLNKTNLTEQHQGDDMMDQTFSLVSVSLLVLISFLGAIGNLLVFKAIFSLKKRKLNEYLILNLAATDAGTCLLSIPLDAVEKMVGEFPYGAALCHLIYPFQSVLVYVSVLTLLFMCVDRYRLIVMPLKQRIHLKTGLATVAVIWVLSCLLVLPLSLSLKFNTFNGSYCSEEWPHAYSGKVFTLTIFTFLYLIPLLVMSVLYSFIIRELFKDRSLKLRRNVSTNSSHPLLTQQQRNLKIVQVFVVAVLVFAVCMLPTHITWLWHDFGSGSRSPGLFGKVVTFSNILMYANSIVNPIIFGSIDVKTLAKLCKALVCYSGRDESREFEQVFVLRTINTASRKPDVRSKDVSAARHLESPQILKDFSSSVSEQNDRHE